jgi:3-hydroxymyristoyl/3-hydroxydecanoyl-(acyl carrier protein) dehydratase
MAPLSDLAQLLPHRPSFLLVDRITQVKEDQALTAERRLSGDDPLLTRDGLLSGPLLIEALCQAAACLNGLALTAADPQRSPLALRPDAPGPAARSGPRIERPVSTALSTAHRGYLVAVSDFHFHDEARAGDTLVLQVTREGRRGPMHAFTATAEAKGGDGAEARPIAAGRLLFAVGGA